MNTQGTLRRWLLALCGLAAMTAAQAQVQRSGGGGGAANAQLMMQYQQATAEKAQLQADNTKLKKDLDDLKKQLDAATKQATASKAGVSRGAAELAAAQAASDRTSKDLADSKARMQELITKFRETITQMHGVETERTQLQQQLDQSKAAFDVCAERNYSLFEVDNEVLDRYSHQGMFSYMARGEPFTRIKRTQIDNLVLEYKERAQQLRVEKAQAAANAAKRLAAPTKAPNATPPAPGAGSNSPPGPAAAPPAGIGNPTVPNRTAPAGSGNPAAQNPSGTPGSAAAAPNPALAAPTPAVPSPAATPPADSPPRN